MKARVFFTPKLQSSPMTSWVHESWPENAVTYPMPGPVSGRGYANYLVRTGGSLFRCSSLEEVLVCIETLAREHLDNPLRKGVFDTGHWLNKLPRGLERWERRERIVRDLRRALATFERETGLHPMPPNRPRRSRPADEPSTQRADPGRIRVPRRFAGSPACGPRPSSPR